MSVWAEPASPTPVPLWRSQWPCTAKCPCFTDEDLSNSPTLSRRVANGKLQTALDWRVSPLKFLLLDRWTSTRAERKNLVQTSPRAWSDTSLYLTNHVIPISLLPWLTSTLRLISTSHASYRATMETDRVYRGLWECAGRWLLPLRQCIRAAIIKVKYPKVGPPAQIINYPGITIICCIYVLNYHARPHKYVAARH